ncbi:MAG TPA: hypothetical protein VNH44_10965, partial [Micropepsaceae bacterium]|nr:hypothetical protein [Micropepsaceae bacterium]
VGTGLGNTTLGDQYIDATRRAQSHLAAIGTVTPLRPGIQSGNDGGGYSWEVRISEPVLHAGASGPAEQRPLGLYTVEVVLSWGSGAGIRTILLQSQRLAYLADGNG